MSPFPWAKLPKLTRREIEATRRVRATIGRVPGLHEIAAALTKLTGAPVELSVAHVGLAPHVAPHTLDVWLTPDGDRSRVYFAMEPGLVAALSAAMLGRPAAPHRPDHPPTPELVGAGSALAVALLRRITQHPWRLSASRALPDAVWIDLVALVGEQPYAISVAAPLPSFGSSPRPYDRRDLSLLGETPITLSLVAAVSTLPRDELTLLEPGAAYLPGEAWSLRRDESGVWSGRGWLATGTGEVGIPVQVERGTNGPTIVLSTGSAALPWVVPPSSADDQAAAGPAAVHREGAPSVDPNDNVTVEALESAPVVVRVEIGTLTMSAGEWARLAPGDVVGTGLRLGEPVTLRAGGVVYGRGELCDVEGELAIRLLSRGEFSR